MKVTVKQRVQQLLMDLLELPDGTQYQNTHYVGVCGYLISDWPKLLEGRIETYDWCSKHAQIHLGEGMVCFVDRPANILTPKRREFVEFLLTKIDELPDMSYEGKEDA